MSDAGARIAENLARVRAAIAAAAERSGRTAAAITLVGATKYVSAETARLLVDGGCRDLGESRPQELWSKAQALADLDVRWHLIGHLQRNKIRRTLRLVRLVQSLDSTRLGAAIEAEAAQLDRSIDALVEVNISKDASKTGLPPDEVEPLLTAAAAWPHVRIRGLMGMARLDDDPASARADFEALRNLRDRLAVNVPPEVCLDELSMGMSGDFEVAIEAGATIVRIGSALFEGVE